MEDFLTHACEQVLRFSRTDKWDDLLEARKVQLGYNLGVVALGLKLSKEEGYQALANAREGKISMQDFHDHMKSLIEARGVKVDAANIALEF